MKNFLSLLLVFAMALALAGCSGSSSPQRKGSGKVTQAVQAVYPKAIKADDYDAKWKNQEENEVDKDFLSAVNRFGWNTASKLLDNGETNVLCSPYSLYYALALAAEGTDGATADQLYALLGADRETAREQSGKLFRLLYTDDGKSTLTIANSIWTDEEVNVDGQPVSITFNEEYKKLAAEDYYSSLYNADFSSDATADAIAKWISDATKGLLSYRPQVSAETMTAIINAIYFNSRWISEFDKSNTTPDTFTHADGSTSQQDFMHQTTTDFYYEGANFTYASLNLGNGSMHFYLPNEGVSVEELLRGNDLFQETADAREAFWRIREEEPYENWEETPDIQWSVPKIQCDSQLEAVGALKELGVTDIFDVDAADFSRLSDTPAFINQIIQGTHIGVDEEGVEAAAFTFMEMTCGAGMPIERSVVEMNLNRPFLYTVNGNNGTVLFAGIYG